MEASGGYERTAHHELVAQGVLAAIVNPKRVRDFARGMGLEAKTDRVDARLIARYGEVMRPARDAGARPGARGAARDPGLPPPADRRDHRAHSSSSSICRARPCARGSTKALAFLRQEAKELDQAAAADDPGRRGAGRRLRAADLACPAAARSWPPPCWPRCPSWAASTAARSRPSPASPRSPGTAACARTAASSRAAAARSAAPSTWPPSPRCGSRPARSRHRYDQLIARGKAPKLALTALMRKMLVTLNAMLKARQAWKDPREA